MVGGASKNSVVDFWRVGRVQGFDAGWVGIEVCPRQPRPHHERNHGDDHRLEDSRNSDWFVGSGPSQFAVDRVDCLVGGCHTSTASAE